MPNIVHIFIFVENEVFIGFIYRIVGEMHVEGVEIGFTRIHIGLSG